MSAVAGVRELFVWYRVDDRRAGEARAAVEAMQRTLVSTCPGLQARLLIRCGGGGQTWMETYARPAPDPNGSAGIDTATETVIAAAAALALREWIDGERHCEAFEVIDRG